jgi:thymidylate kinase
MGEHLRSDSSLLARPELRVEETASERPLIVELVGPAGAGKTTVLRAVGRRDRSIRAGLHIDRFRFLPMMARQGLTLAPAGFELMRQSPRSWLSGMVHLLRLSTLAPVLGRVASPAYRAIMLDEGPVFSLTRLSVFHSGVHRDGRLAREWLTALKHWAEVLTAVFWLDAPNPVLLDRIRSRLKDHRIKAGTEQQAYDFLDRYRRAYLDVFDRMTAIGKVRVVCLDAPGESADQVATRILATLDHLGQSRDPAKAR